MGNRDKYLGFAQISVNLMRSARLGINLPFRCQEHHFSSDPEPERTEKGRSECSFELMLCRTKI